jgi:hypothetical protein
MGRPLKKDVNGVDVVGLARLGNTGLRVSGYFDGALTSAGTTTGYSIIKQRGAQTFVVAKIENFTCNTTSGSPIITNMSDQVEVTIGDEVSGAGIPDGTRVLSIDSATQVTLTQNATATATGITAYHFGAFKVGTTVDTTPNANGEILIQGYNTAGSGQGAQVTANLVPIRKLTRRIAYGFPSSPVLNAGGSFQNSEDSNASTNHDEAKYYWSLSNDSSADYIVLTPFTTKM